MENNNIAILVEANMESMFYRVEEDDICRVKAETGITVPPELEKFWREVGYGFFSSDNGNVNRVMDPLSVIDFRFTQGDFEFLPDIEIYEEFGKDKLIFFEGNESAYISIGFTEDNLGKIYYYDDKIAENLQDFFERISKDDMYYVKES